MLGSPSYCAPEQLRNEPPTPGSDLYAWGLVVIECLTGEVVMQGASVADILYQQLSPVDVALPPSIASQPLGSVLRHALSKHPAQRAASADELAAQFRVLNFAALVGPFDAGRASRRTRPQPFAPRSDAVATAGEYRQVTTLCCCVTIAGDGRQRHAGTDHGALLDRYEAQWLTKCADIAVGYGAQVDERLGDTLLFHFGLQGDIDRPRAAHVRHSTWCGWPGARVAGAGRSRLYGQRRRLARRIGRRDSRRAGSRACGAVGGRIDAGRRVAVVAAGRAGQILISDDARLALERHVDFRPTGLRLARAGLAPQPVHELLGERRADTPFDSLDGGMRAPMIGRTRELGALLRAWQETLARHRRVMRCAAAARRRRRGNRQVAPRTRAVRDRAGTGPRVRALRMPAGAGESCAVSDPAVHRRALATRRRQSGRHHARGDRRDARGARMRSCGGPCRACGLAGAACDAKAARWPGAREQDALFDVLEQLIVSLGNGAPVLLVVDDVQWIDRSTEDFLAYLQRSSRAAALCIVLTSRPVRLARWGGMTSARYCAPPAARRRAAPDVGAP